MQKHTVVILGTGRFGKSLAHMFRRAGARVELWDKDPSKVRGQKELSAVIPPADMVFLSIPSFALASALADIRSFLGKSCIVVSPIKGIDRRAGGTPAEIIKKHVPRQPFVILGGPMLAEELDKNLGGTAVLASPDIKSARRVASLLDACKVNTVCSVDASGVAIVGVLKNVYALALGIAEGLGWGMNLRGSLAAMAVAEMRAILKTLGDDPDTALGAAGLGDFIATGFSHHSRNHGVGMDLAKGKSPRFKGEGGVSLPALIALLAKKKKKANTFPILSAVARVVAGKVIARKAFRKILIDGKAR